LQRAGRNFLKKLWKFITKYKQEKERSVRSFLLPVPVNLRKMFYRIYSQRVLKFDTLVVIVKG
jgi:hypothetical protein